RQLINPEVLSQLKAAQNAEDVQSIFSAAEETADKENSKETESVGERPFVVAVTACPTGIAHTYMAEDALKRKAAELGVDIRVETNGSEGAKNILTDEEIQRASAVI